MPLSYSTPESTPSQTPPSDPPTQQRPQSPRPAPRTHSPASLARIRIKNRRKRYLDLHPSYFASPSRELADPLAYDRLIRRFQSAAEREAEGKRKGYSGVLEADLWRSEARVAAAAFSHHEEGLEVKDPRDEGNGGIGGAGERKRDYEMAASKEEGRERWRELVEERFLRGEDEGFDYGGVDGGEEWDGVEVEREREERWFEEEEEEEEEGVKGKGLKGETGVQDF
ncbi:MAG: hypothetical protein Q9208_006290 [Pyrenodesmia sp. 3 TL-2023]